MDSNPIPANLEALQIFSLLPPATLQAIHNYLQALNIPSPLNPLPFPPLHPFFTNYSAFSQMQSNVAQTNSSPTVNSFVPPIPTNVSASDDMPTLTESNANSLLLDKKMSLYYFPLQERDAVPRLCPILLLSRKRSSQKRVTR